MARPQKEEREEKYKVFGDVDRDEKGKISSQYPSWYHSTQIDELEESVRRKEYQLSNDLVPASEKNITRERLSQEKDRLNKIKASKPKISGMEEDEIKNMSNELGDKIKESMFTRSDMDKGLADAHEEARRMSEPCIEIKSENQAEFAKSCGIKIPSNGKISRNQAEKMWKIQKRILGDISNTEILRKG